MFNELISTLARDPLFGLSFILVGGYALGSLAERIRLPEITGFIITGLIAGPYALAIIPAEVTAELQLITEVALAIIAFTVGSALQRSTLSRVARPVAMMAGGHLLMSFLFVTAGLWLAGLRPSIAVLMGVLAGGSSPGTVVAIVQHERARGTFVEQLFGVVAVATALTITLFGIVFAFKPALLGVATSGGMTSILVSALTETVISVIGGIFGGIVLHLITRRNTSQSRTIILTFGVLFTATATALAWNLSTLLVNMAIGVTYINLSRQPLKVMQSVRLWSPPLYAVFFVLAGAKLNPSVLGNPTILLLGATYVVSRIIGSYTGTALGAKLGGADTTTAKYLPLCLVPQAGVALGLILVLEDAPLLELVSPEVAASLTQTISIMLLAILLKEIVGPPISAAAVRRGAIIDRE